MADVHYDIPNYQPDEQDELIKCDCHYHCDNFKRNEMVEGYGGDMLAIIHKAAYLENYVDDLSNYDYDLLEKSINNQIKKQNEN